MFLFKSVFVEIVASCFLSLNGAANFNPDEVIDNFKTFLDDSQLGVMGIRVKRGVKVRYTPSASSNHNSAFQGCHLDNWPFTNLSYEPFVSKI